MFKQLQRLRSLLTCWPFGELPITPPVAAALLTGLVTDTIGFRTSNVNRLPLRLAADLMECGADLRGNLPPRSGGPLIMRRCVFGGPAYRG